MGANLARSRSASVDNDGRLMNKNANNKKQTRYRQFACSRKSCPTSQPANSNINNQSRQISITSNNNSRPSTTLSLFSTVEGPVLRLYVYGPVITVVSNNDERDQQKEQEQHQDISVTLSILEPDFTILEIAQIKTSFEQIKLKRDEIALLLLQRIATIDGAVEIYQNALPDMDNNWNAVSLGIKVLSGIERCVLRMDNPKALRMFLKRLMTSHSDGYNVPFDTMLQSLQITHLTLLEAIASKEHQGDDDGQCWDKFFLVITNLIKESTVADHKTLPDFSF